MRPGRIRTDPAPGSLRRWVVAARRRPARRAAGLRAGLGWLGAVAAGVLVFEGLDLLGSSPSAARIPGAASLPAISPFLAGAVAAWRVPWGAPLSLLAAAASVWARIGVDRGLGVLRGGHLPAEAGLVLVLAFGAPWTVMALAGGAAAVVLRLAARRRAYGSSPRVR
jgi:hypothetical protein